MTLRYLICASVLTLALLFGACADDTSSPDTPLSGIPYLTGTSSTYLSTFVEDSSGIIMRSNQDSVFVTVVSNDASVNGMTGLTMLEARLKRSGAVFQTVYYRCNADSVTELAYRFNGMFNVGLSAFPKAGQAVPNTFFLTMPRTTPIHRRTQDAMDSTIQRADPRIVYRFPLSVGKKWTSFTSPFLQTREVVGTEVVSVRAGTFICLKIRSTVNTDLEFYDYVAAQGLILRTLEADMVLTTETSPFGDGTMVHITERLELIAQQ